MLPFRSGLARSIARRRLSTQSFFFDKEAQVEKVRDGLVVANVSNQWSVGDAPNGGFLFYLALQAASLHCEHPDPLTMTAYYVNKGVENAPAEISVRVISKVRTTTTLHLSLSQQGVVRSEYIGTFGNLSAMKGFTLVNKPNLQLPPIQECFNATKALRNAFGDQLSIARQIEARVPKSDPLVSLMTGKAGDRAELNSYVRFTDNRAPCLSSLGFFLDCLPPPSVCVTPTSWVPTLEYTVHFWEHPQAAVKEGSSDTGETWLASTFHSSFIKNSLLYTDGEIWSQDGSRLLATSRQFARIMDKR